MDKTDVLYLVMPAYNEEENIENVVKQWYRVLENTNEMSRFIVADSGSTDNTHGILVELQKKYDKLEILSDTEKQHGPKLMSLYKQAILNDADFIFQTDSDGQTNPEEFNAFWNMRHIYEGIFGNRVTREDGKTRSLVESVVCILLRMYFGVSVPDANAPFRLMDVNTVKKYLYNLPDDYNLPNIMLTTYFVYYQENVLFKEISFKERQGGKNSIDICAIIKIGLNALRDFRNFRKKMSVTKINNRYI